MTMFSLLLNTNIPSVANAWKIWVDHIMKQKEALGYRKAAIAAIKNGMTQSATSGFILPTREVQRIGDLMSGKAHAERISVQGKTYIVKSLTENQLVAFSGSKYLIVCKSKTFYVIAVCESKQKHENASLWLKKLTAKLIERDF